MKILLDENIDIRFKLFFPDIHEVYTVRNMEWNAIKNGALLKLLGKNEFDCWIVGDKNLPYQQNVSTLPSLVIVPDVFRNTLKHLTLLLPSELNALNNSTKDKVIVNPGTI